MQSAVAVKKPRRSLEHFEPDLSHAVVRHLHKSKEDLLREMKSTITAILATRQDKAFYIGKTSGTDPRAALLNRFTNRYSQPEYLGIDAKMVLLYRDDTNASNTFASRQKLALSLEELLIEKLPTDLKQYHRGSETYAQGKVAKPKEALNFVYLAHL